jgi:MFS family permease
MNGNSKRNIIAYYISNVVLGTYFQLPIWIVYQSKFLSFEQIAFYSGLALIVEVIMQLPTGAFADLFGRRLSLALGNLFMALPMFLIAMYPQPQIMFAFSFMWGLGRAFCMGTSQPIVYESLEAEGKVNLFPKILGRATVTFQVSAAISILLGGYMYIVWPQLPYYVSGTTSLFGLFTSYIFIEPNFYKNKFHVKKFIEKNREGFVEIFKNNYMTRLTILYALMLGLANSNQQFFIQPYMLELGMNDIERSWVSTIIKVAIALVGMWMASNRKIFNKRSFILFLPILMVITLIPAKFVALPYALIIFTGIAFASGNTTLFLSPEINNNIRSSVRSTANSAQKMLASLVGAIAQWISGSIIMQSSVGTFYMYLGFFTLLFILPLAWNIMSHKDRINLQTDLQ